MDTIITFIENAPFIAAVIAALGGGIALTIKAGWSALKKLAGKTKTHLDDDLIAEIEKDLK